MITCQVCRQAEPEGEFFCSACGARLPASPADFAPTMAFTGRMRAREGQRVTWPRPEDLPAGQIVLTVEGVAQRVLLGGRAEYLLGRDGQGQQMPDVDLSQYGGREKGVSRAHALLRGSPDQLLLVDLGSTNGTRLNGIRLAAHQPVRVESGDEIRLGELTLRVHFLA